jgi:hypothetical protein
MLMWAAEYDFDGLIRAAASNERPTGWSVDAFMALMKAHIGAESSFSPGAYHFDPKVNDASRGLMQIEGATARDLGYFGDLGDDNTRTGGLYDPELNVRLGAQLIHRNLSYARQYLDAAISAYNAGFGGSWMGKQTAPGVFVNQTYVDRVKQYFAHFLNQQGVTAPLGTNGPTTASAPSTPTPTTTVQWVVLGTVVVGALATAAYFLLRGR